MKTIGTWAKKFSPCILLETNSVW